MEISIAIDSQSLFIMMKTDGHSTSEKLLNVCRYVFKVEWNNYKIPVNRTFVFYWYIALFSIF